MATDAWYYAHNRQRIGPVSFAQMRELAASGRLQPTDMVLREGTRQWVPAGAVEGLLPATVPTITSRNGESALRSDAMHQLLAAPPSFRGPTLSAADGPMRDQARSASTQPPTTEKKEERYWLLINGAPQGPLSFEQIAPRLEAGQINWDTPACPEEGNQWLPLAQLPVFRVQPPPVPPHVSASFTGASATPNGRPTVPLWMDCVNACGFHLRRAFAWDLRDIAANPSEQALLQGNGITDSILQRYLCWRRSVLLLASLPVILIALLGTGDNLEGDYRNLSAVGRLWLGLMILTPFAMPAAVITSAVLWWRQKRGWKIMAWGWAISFLVPITLFLIPAHWLVRIDAASAEERAAAQLGTAFGFGIIVFLSLLVSLTVFTISTAFGVQRACLRLKTLLPDSTVPGLFLAASAPVFPLVLLPLFVLINQLASSPLLILGMLLLMASPLVYAVRAKVFIRPLSTEADFREVLWVQRLAKGMFWSGTGLLVLYGMTRVWAVPRLGGVEEAFLMLDKKTLLGFSETSSYLQPWNWRVIRWLVIETLGRSLFTMILVADLFMRVSGSVWSYSRQAVSSPHAQRYDRLVDLLE